MNYHKFELLYKICITECYDNIFNVMYLKIK